MGAQRDFGCWLLVRHGTGCCLLAAAGSRTGSRNEWIVGRARGFAAARIHAACGWLTAHALRFAHWLLRACGQHTHFWLQSQKYHCTGRMEGDSGAMAANQRCLLLLHCFFRVLEGRCLMLMWLLRGNHRRKIEQGLNVYGVSSVGQGVACCNA